MLPSRTGKLAVLREVEADDLSLVWEWENDSEMGLYLNADPGKRMSMDEVKRRFQQYRTDPTSGLFVICTLAGDAIGMHRHLQEDEILLILRGNAHVDLAGRKYDAGPGGAIYIPQGTCVAVANAGRDTLTTFFIFSSPGFEQVLREVSSLPGEPPKRLSPAERVAAFHRGHAVANPVDC